MGSFAIFDMIIGVVIIIYGVKGLFGGLFKELFGILGVIAGIVLGTHLAEDVGGVINAYANMGSGTLIFLSGFFTIFIATMIVSTIFSYVFKGLFKAAGFGPSEKILGFIFSSVKIFAILSIILYGLSSIKMMQSAMNSIAGNSISYPWFSKFGERVVNIGDWHFEKLKGNINFGDLNKMGPK
jgi:membrane protein required for colicin V production